MGNTCTFWWSCPFHKNCIILNLLLRNVRLLLTSSTLPSFVLIGKELFVNLKILFVLFSFYIPLQHLPIFSLYHLCRQYTHNVCSLCSIGTDFRKHCDPDVTYQKSSQTKSKQKLQNFSFYPISNIQHSFRLCLYNTIPPKNFSSDRYFVGLYLMCYFHHTTWRL